MARRRPRGRAVSGILLLDKPTSIGSNEVLQVVKRLFQARKAGHTGSLDRLASGLLPICLGEATKISGFLLNADKRYQARIRLGVRTTTGDAEGAVVESRPVREATRERVNTVVRAFVGDIEQVPPMHSAIKHQGQRLYKLAHQGLTVERKPRRVTIHALDVVDVDDTFLGIEVHCSKGTYIRTLAEDIGERLGCGAHVASLRRVGAGPFSGEDMIALEELREAAAKGLDTLDGYLWPMEAALAEWPRVSLPDAVAYYLKQGQPVLVPHAPTAGWVRIYAGAERFLGVGEVLDDGRVAPRRLLQLQ